MNESDNNNQSLKMEAEAGAGVKVLAECECGNGAFVVHTKHTCDACFQQPIIGKRFTSTARANFDICASCFATYNGPDISLAESMLARDKKQSCEFVLKLKIKNEGDEQVRRMNVSEIWGKSISRLSFGKMMTIASSHAFPGDTMDDAGLSAFIAKAKATYIDEDGDKITMTSNAELEDAFRQVLKKFPIHKPFRITVTIPKRDTKGCAMAAGKTTGIPKRVQLRKVGHGRKVFESHIIDGKPKTTLLIPPQKFEKKFFIHARHTCDGCSKTPIIGTRYHATKIPDFDLCSTCFEKYEGEDLDFKPEIQERDRHMQQRWLKKQLNHSPKAPCNVVGMWNEASGDLADFLKKVQESGASIESATVYASPPVQDASTAPEAKKSEESPSAKDVTVEVTDANAAPEAKKSEESPSAKDVAVDVTLPSKETDDIVKAETEAVDSSSKGKSETPNVETEPGSPVASVDESFFSDADGNGSIAEAIGRTLDVCVAAFEEAMVDGIENDDASTKGKSQKSSVDKDVDAAAAVAADAFSVASSMVSSMTDVLKKMEEAKKADSASQALTSQPHDGARAAASTGVPSVVTGATILESKGDDTENENDAEMAKAEDASFGEDEWSVVEDDNGQAKKDEVQSVISALSPILLAKWDTELHQLHELGFLDDRKNVDVLEALEASHVGVDSTEQVTINAALGRLLGER